MAVGVDGVRAWSNVVICSVFCSWTAAIGGGERTGAGTSALLYLSIETSIQRTPGVGDIYSKQTESGSALKQTGVICFG